MNSNLNQPPQHFENFLQRREEILQLAVREGQRIRSARRQMRWTKSVCLIVVACGSLFFLRAQFINQEAPQQPVVQQYATEPVKIAEHVKMESTPAVERFISESTKPVIKSVEDHGRFKVANVLIDSKTRRRDPNELNSYVISRPESSTRLSQRAIVRTGPSELKVHYIQTFEELALALQGHGWGVEKAGDRYWDSPQPDGKTPVN